MSGNAFSDPSALAQALKVYVWRALCHILC